MLRLVDDTNIQCYENLSQHYEAEFSVLTGKKPDTNGLYYIKHLDENYKGYLYFKEQLPVGFVVVDISGSSYDIAEFYVIPTERRNGIGRQMASEIFDIYQGSWQVRQIEGAEQAYGFWVSVIKEYTKDDFSNDIENDAEWGIVRIQRFKSRSARF